MNTSQDYKEQIRLTEAKKQRKQAEEDFRLLSNRVTLLKLEEQKALKKIEETRRKAQEITNIRNRNSEEQRKKEELRKQREEEEMYKLESNKLQKTDLNNLRIQATQYKINRNFNEAQNIKKMKAQIQKTIEANRTLDMAQKAFVISRVKNAEMYAKEKIKKEKEEKILKVRANADKKVDEEIMKRRKRIEEIERMEKEEMELIQRLQVTQLMQKSAFDDLELALNGNNTGFEEKVE